MSNDEKLISKGTIQVRNEYFRTKFVRGCVSCTKGLFREKIGTLKSRSVLTGEAVRARDEARRYEQNATEGLHSFSLSLSLALSLSLSLSLPLALQGNRSGKFLRR